MSKTRHIERSDWYGLYKERWGDEIVKDAMGHPAKFARGLIRKIYEHAIEENWLKPGDTVLDPFGGVALGGIDAMHNGLHHVSVELEPRFVQLGQENIDLWNKRYGDLFPVWGSAIILQGDSRKLTQVLADVRASPRGGEGADTAVASPPFAGVSSDGGWQMLDKYAKKGKLTVDQVKGDPSKSYPSWSEDRDTSYGHSEGQMADMKNTDEGLDAAVASPPFMQTSGGTNVTAKDGPLSDPGLIERHRAGNRATKGYGDAEENLGNMPETEDGYDLATASPPYSGTRIAETGDIMSTMRRSNDGDGYGVTEGQLSGMNEGDVKAAIGSPPYINTPVVDYGENPGGGLAGRNSANVRSTEWVDETGYGEAEGQLSNMKEGDPKIAISSPPYAEARIGQDAKQEQIGHNEAYGDTDGQLGGMKDKGADSAISSPPFVGSINDGLSDEDREKYAEFKRAGRSVGQDYGDAEGQLGTMKDKGAAGAVSSPPFESVTSDRPSKNIVDSGLRMGASSMGDGYGETPGNIGNDTGDDFWMASRAILDQTYAVLKPGGHAIWVCKRFVKNKKLVYFPRQWAKVAEAAGFRVVHWHRAMQIEYKGTQYDLFGGKKDITIRRASFFRRLAEKKGSPPILWEDVLCMIKPE